MRLLGPFNFLGAVFTVWSQTAAAVPVAADATHTHRPPSLPRLTRRDKRERRREGGRRRGRRGWWLCLGRRRRGARRDGREEARNCRNFPISHHVIVILLPILLLFPSSCSSTRQPRPRPRPSPPSGKFSPPMSPSLFCLPPRSADPIRSSSIAKSLEASDTI